MNWEAIITSPNTILGLIITLGAGLLKFNSNFAKLGEEVKNLGKRMEETKTDIEKRVNETKTEMGKRMDEMKTDIEKRDVKIDKKFEEVKGEIKEIKTGIEKRDEKIEKTLKERDEKIDKKFDEVKGDIKDLRTEITGRKVMESFDGIKTDIRYIREGFARSEERSREKLRSGGSAGTLVAKEKAGAKQVSARRALAGAGFEPLEESVKRESGQKSAAIA